MLVGKCLHFLKRCAREIVFDFDRHAWDSKWQNKQNSVWNGRRDGRERLTVSPLWFAYFPRHVAESKKVNLDTVDLAVSSAVLEPDGSFPASAFGREL
jgi:hypothetical protein